MSQMQLLEPADYLQRLQAAQSAMHKSLLILVALVAFWLAIENTYTRYVDLFELNVALRQNEIRANQLTQFKAQLGTSAASSRSRILERTDLNLEDSEKARAEYRAAIKELRKESVDLSIAGTKLPSQLSIAPSLWLSALLCWLFYFSARRASAHRNLAAYCAALQKEERAFGSAGEGSMWIAPLPSAVHLNTGPDVQDIGRDELLSCIGWTHRTEQQYRIAFLLLILFCAFMIVRTVMIALDLTGDFALSTKFASEAWRLPGTVIPVFVALVSAAYLVNLFLRPNRGSLVEETTLLSRRTFLAGTASVGMTAAIWLSRDSLLGEANKRGLARTDPAQRATELRRGGARFIAKLRKERRLRNYAVKQTVRERNTLLYSARPARSGRRLRTSASVHFANAMGEIRFFSVAERIHHLRAVTILTEARIAGRRGALVVGTAEDLDFPLSSRRLLAWEAAALAEIEANRIDAACQVLMTGIRLSMPTTGAASNLRLVDLLAGLAIRFDRKSTYLEELMRMATEKIAATRSRTVLSKPARRRGRAISGAPAARAREIQNPLVGRLEKWRDAESKWHKRWADKNKPVWWHHPLESRLFQWKRTMEMRRPPKDPEARQRPVRIA